MATTANNNGVVIERNVMVPMRDGVRLATDIYRPDKPGRFPVLLQRLPYGKNILDRVFLDPTLTAQRDYVVIVQDSRGRFDSEGEWYPFHCEVNDSYDAVEWAAVQPWSNGKVGMFSGSYIGATQCALAGNLWVLTAVACILSYIAYLYLAWFYLYLVNARGFSVLSGGLYSTAPFLAGALTSLNLSRRFGKRLGRCGMGFGSLLLTVGLICAGATAEDPFGDPVSVLGCRVSARLFLRFNPSSSSWIKTSMNGRNVRNAHGSRRGTRSYGQLRAGGLSSGPWARTG